MCLRSLTVSQAISSQRLFEDREGNIWVATVDGLDRFRDFAVPTISVKQGLSNAIVGPSWRPGMAAFGLALVMA